MAAHPLLGVIMHWLGGLASASFYVPYRRVGRWSWETYWLVGGIFSWLVCPALFAQLLTANPFSVIASQSFGTLAWTYFFGVLWGFGGLTFGLTMRYLGLSLGMGVTLGYCAAFGTILPPLAKSIVPTIPVPESLAQIAATTAGRVTLAGVGVCLLGIGIAALAGIVKERELPPAAKQASIAEFNFKKGILLATISGIMSACFAFGLTAGQPMGDASIAAGTRVIWSGLPKLVVILLGGFTTNAAWCLLLNFRNRTGREYFAVNDGAKAASAGPHGECPATPTPADAPASPGAQLAYNYALCALAGTLWYLQFFFYTIGETQMGTFGFASWTLHMASIIIFSTLWGWHFHEWKGSSKKTHGLILLGIVVLVLSTIVIGLGTYLKGAAVPH